jgi:hypothetical protein
MDTPACRLVALLCFYDERPDWLYETVASLPLAGVDHLVASDGAYALLPDGQHSSGPDSHVALYEAAQVAGIGLTLHVPTKTWAGNELEKRTHLFALGDEHAPDWFLVIDADERILRAPANLKQRLAETDRDYADVMSLERPAPVYHASAEGADWPQIHYEHHVKPRRCLIRAVPGIVVGPAHYNYVTPDGRDLWGDEMGTPLRVRDLMIDHRTHLRDPSRTQLARDWVRIREETGAETHRKGLPSWAR